MSKRVLSLVLALVMVLGAFSTVFAAETENEKVAKLVELGLVVGDAGTGNLRLADPIKRSEVSVMVVKALDLGEVANASVTFPSIFKDMSPAHWANGFVNVAAGRGFISGYPDGTFKADNNVNYAEMASMLVRVLNGLTEDEQKVAVWPTTWLAKAAELGLFDGFAVADYNAPATRENVFNMVFNALTAKGSTLLVANTVEGIVVENYRTESLNKDDIVVHVMKDQVEKSGTKYGKDDEFKVTIDKELKAKGLDVETLLGKVVTVSFDKNDKVVDIKVSDSYQYLQGTITDVGEKELKLNDKWYTVAKDEGRTADDERLFQAYFNNEDVHYYDSKDFDTKGKVDVENPRSFAGKVNLKDNKEYARLTVRNGKVLFVEAFDFIDIAPVAKDIDSKNVVKYYDDSKDGEINNLTVGDAAYVVEVNVVDGKTVMTLGSNEDISAGDVIHWYKSGNRNELTVFVRPSENNVVEGVYKETSAKRAKGAADIMINVDAEDYPAYIGTENRNPVYSTLASALEFLELTRDYDKELAPFEKEEVTLSLDMFGFVQSISAEKVDGKFYALVSNTSRSKGEVKLVKVDNENEWYETDRDTVFAGVTKGTKDKEFNQFDKYDLVLATASDGMLTRLEKVEPGFGPKEIVKLNRDVIDFGGSDWFHVSKKAVLFVEQDLESMSIADFIKNYDQDKLIEGYIVKDAKDLVNVIVITNATSKKAKPDTVVAKVDRVYTGKGDVDYELRLEIPGQEELSRHLVDEDEAADAIELLKKENVVAGAVVEVKLSKDDDKNIVGMKLLLSADNDKLEPKQGLYKVLKVENRSRNEDYITIEDANGHKETILVSRTADVFGEYKTGSYVAIGDVDKFMTVSLVDVRKGTEATAVWGGTTTPDKTDVEKVNGLINALPATIALADEAEVVAARTAYNKLTAAQKAEVGEARLLKLVAAENEIVRLKQADVTLVNDKVDSAVVDFETDPAWTQYHADGTTPGIINPESEDGVTFALSFEPINSLTGKAEINAQNNIVITRGNLDFEFVVKLTATKGTATATKEFVVFVPTTGSATIIAK